MGNLTMLDPIFYLNLHLMCGWTFKTKHVRFYFFNLFDILKKNGDNVFVLHHQLP